MGQLGQARRERMGLFSRNGMISGGQYMFYTGVVYFIAGMINLFVYKFWEVEYIQMIWILVLLVPVLFPIKYVENSPFWRTR